MLLKNNIFSRQKISWKISIFIWLGIMSFLLVFTIVFVSYTNSVFKKKLSNEAQSIVRAVSPSLKSALIVDDFTDFLDFSLTYMNQNENAEYLNITSLNGLSITIAKDYWRIDTIKVEQKKQNISAELTEFITSDFSGNEVFQFTTEVEMYTVVWGYAKVGLKIDEYNSNESILINFATWMGLLSAVISLVYAFIFSYRLVRPINTLTKMAYEVSEGNYNVKCEINSNDELEILGNTFNKMTTEIFNSHSILESKVKQRTSELQQLNDELTKEVELRANAEKVIKNALDEKTTLLQEIHHRVKNNLQIISSLLYLQVSKTTNKDIISVLLDSQSRVKSMALVHEKLYRSDNLSSIEFSDYIKDLTKYTINSYGHRNIDILYDLEKIQLSINSAIPCGLIINELLSNVYKYAFVNYENKEKPTVRISLFLKDDSQICFKIKDNGKGFPENFKIEETNSLGLKLAQNLTMQLDGKFEYKSENGLEITVSFNEKKEEL